jgi:hypothetical protein
MGLPCRVSGAPLRGEAEGPPSSMNGRDSGVLNFRYRAEPILVGGTYPG